MSQRERFTYSPLRPREIRLITLLPGNDSEKIYCSLQHASLDDNPEFEALSYTWGADELFDEIWIDGKAFYVRRNLWFALHHFRGTKRTIPRNTRDDELVQNPSTKNRMSKLKPWLRSLRRSKLRGKHASVLSRIPESAPEFESNESLPRAGKEGFLIIWIDAICIDQSNDRERSSQVQLMGNIFEQCKKLRIWLGEQSLFSQCAIKNFQVSDDKDKIPLDGFTAVEELFSAVEGPGDGWYSKETPELFFDSIFGLYVEELDKQDLLGNEVVNDQNIVADSELEDLKKQVSEFDKDWSSMKREYFHPGQDAAQEHQTLSRLRDLSSRSLSSLADVNSYLQKYGRVIPSYDTTVARLQGLIDATGWVENGPYGTPNQLHSKYADSRVGIFDICQRAYWGRLWVIQEAVLGREATIHCGAGELPWGKFEAFLSAQAVVHKGVDPEESKTTPGFRISSFTSHDLNQTPAAGFMKAYSVTKSAGLRNSSLRSLITSFSEAQTKDPRDMAYGLLALADPSHGIIPDYSKSTAELYAEISKTSLWREADDYFVSFCQILQRVLGDPFWDHEFSRVIEMGPAILKSYGNNDVLQVTGLDSLVVWGKFTSLQTGPSESENHNSKFDSTRQLTAKQRAWLKLNRFSTHVEGPHQLEPDALYKQSFTVNPFHGMKQRQGTALLLHPCGYGDHLCFFKDCQIVAIVHGEKIVGHALIDTASLVPLKDWTMQCKVTMNIAELQRLTM